MYRQTLQEKEQREIGGQPDAHLTLGCVKDDQFTDKPSYYQVFRKRVFAWIAACVCVCVCVCVCLRAFTFLFLYYAYNVGITAST